MANPTPILKKFNKELIPQTRAVVAIEGEILRISREYFYENGFFEITIPHITRATGSCENMETLFDVNYFGKQAHLLQTGQLFLELLTPILGKVWCYGPSFRAEPRVDGRHLAEFGLIEMEFAGTFEQLLSHMENLVNKIVNQVLRLRCVELEVMNVDCRRLSEMPSRFKRLTYDQATKILELVWGKDLNRKHEAALLGKFGNQPLFITHYPKQIKFFNMKTNDANPRVVNSADLILPFSGEAIGAAEREFEYEKAHAKLKSSTMLKQLKRRGGDIEDFQWYLRHLKEGMSLPHSGFGMGLSRVTQFLLGKEDIRECTLFPLNKETIM